MENNSIFEQAWLLVVHIGILEQWHLARKIYITLLTEAHVHIKEGIVELIWTPTDHGLYSPKVGYPIIQFMHIPLVLFDWWGKLWNLKAPPRMKLFMWNIIWNNLREKHGISLLCQSHRD